MLGSPLRLHVVLSATIIFLMSRVESSTVLVTGGAGYIGSHVCKELAKAGTLPISYDTLESGHKWAVRWGPLECGDIGDAARLDDVITRYRPDAVIHLAGYIDVGESVRSPERYLQNNVEKSKTLIETMLRHGLNTLIFSSTCAIYGVPRTEFLTESHAISPLSPYAESKFRTERLINAAIGRGLRAVSLRYFNAAGADPDGQIGEAHHPEHHLLPLAADAALGLGPALTLLGDDYPTPDGSCVRDFVHVVDLAVAHIKALDWLVRAPKGGVHEVFNIGSGTGYSVREVIAEMSRIAGHDVPHAIGARRTGDSPRLVGDISKASRILGWHPERNLTQQIEDTLRWRRKMAR